MLRFLQGLGLGGEWGGAVLLTAEHAPADRRALWSSFPQVGPAVGFLLANGVMLALSASLTEAAVRRLGVAGAVLGGGRAGRWRGCGCGRRSRRVPSSCEIDEPARVPLAELVRDHWRLVLLTAGALAVGYAIFYAVTTWSLAYGDRAARREPYRHADLHHGAPWW